MRPATALNRGQAPEAVSLPGSSARTQTSYDPIDPATTAKPSASQYSDLGMANMIATLAGGVHTPSEGGLRQTGSGSLLTRSLPSRFAR